MNQKINYSIIIPHKNTPSLLQRCLDSIPNQEDIQVIIVDDNSDETIVDFSKFPGFERENVEIYFTKESKGAGYARNIGLQHVKGKWLLFADADDFFTENAFDYLFQQISSTQDIIYYKAASCYSNTLEPTTTRNRRTNQFIDDFLDNKTENAEYKLRYKFEPWGKMIKMDLIKKENIKFDEVISGNDAMFSVLSGHYAKSITAVKNIMYCATVNKGSISYTQNLENLVSRYTVALRCNDFLKKKDKKQYRQSIMPFLYFSITHYGVKIFFNFLRLAFCYQCNPFIGISSWLPSYFRFKKERENDKNYIVIKNNKAVI